MPKRPDWSLPLTKPYTLKDGTVLRTLGDVRAFILDRMPPEFQERPHWLVVVEQILLAAESGDTRSASVAVWLALAIENALSLSPRSP